MKHLCQGNCQQLLGFWIFFVFFLYFPLKIYMYGYFSHSFCMMRINLRHSNTYIQGYKMIGYFISTHEKFLTIDHFFRIFFHIFQSELPPCWQTLGQIVENKVVWKLKLLSSEFYKKCGPEIIFFNYFLKIPIL